MNRGISRITKDLSRLESERSFRTTVVYIEAVSPDQTRARCKMMTGASKGNEIFEARIILTPGIHFPINVGSYMGLLHGDPKSPIGVQLIPKATPVPNVEYGISSSIFGNSGAKKSTSVDGRIEKDPDNFTQGLNKLNHPNGQSIVIKPPKTVPRAYIGDNKVTQTDPSILIDKPGAHVYVGEDEVRIIADSGNGIVINAESGISMLGKVNIASAMEDVRMGGAWKENPMKMFQIPSTAVTPIPDKIWSPPGTKLLNNITKYLNQIKSV